MKWLKAIGFMILLGIVLMGCKMSSDDKDRKAEKVDPEDILTRVPPGVPADEGSLYKVTGLGGLISYGDSLLVQISPLTTLEARAWDENEKNAKEAARLLAVDQNLEKFTVRVGNTLMIRIPDPKNEGLKFAYFYLVPDQSNENFRLRALCFGRTKLYEPDSSCFFGYRSQGKHIEFNLDERTVSNGQFEKIENMVFRQLPLDKPDLK